jgi:nucleoside-diphosphate-sugar epimerase
MSKGELVLITGASGHIGFRTLIFALNAGYRVRAAVRNESKRDLILSTQSVRTINPGEKLTFIYVPDLLHPTAYDEAVHGVDFILHIASPLTTGIDPARIDEDLIQPAVAGTTGMLSSALKSPSVKRIVVTSSIAAIAPPNKDPQTIYDRNSRVLDPLGPYETLFEGYSASKIKALNATERFINEKSPSFDIVNIMPSFVIGKNELTTNKKNITNGSNGVAFAQILGTKSPYPTIGQTVFIDDVADIHIRALMVQGPGKIQSFVATSNGPDGNTISDAIEIVNKRFPEAVKSGILPNDGFTETKTIRFDASVTEGILGVTFRSYEEQVVSLTEHYLELVENDA